MSDTIAPWLAELRKLEGIREDTDAARIVGFADDIGRAFPDESAYAHLMRDPTTQSWCGFILGYVLSKCGFRPPYNPSDDLKSFMWVDSFASFGVPVTPGLEQPGDILIFRDPHHITLYLSQDTTHYTCLGGNQGNMVKESTYSKSGLRAIRRPSATAIVTAPSPIDIGYPLIMIGTTGPIVSRLQQLLGIDNTGIFDAATDVAVRAFQASRGINVDGEVGPNTWGALLAATASVRPSTLRQQTVDAIIATAAVSDLARHKWSNGMAPRGYTKGMAVMFGVAYAKLLAKDSAALAMAAQPPASGKDAMALYADKFSAAGMNFFRNGGVDTLRALFILQTGLGLRESSGRYCEGRDQSVTNVEADTAEAGLFQQSWDSHTASSEIPKLFAAYSAGVRSFIEIFREGVTPTSRDLENFGAGQGAAFQALAKACPAFAVEAAAVGLRVLRTHWGPIIREEAEIVPAADILFRQVQSIVDAQPLDGDVIPPAKPDDELFIAIAFVLSQEGPMDANLKNQMLAELAKPSPNMRGMLLQALNAAPAGPTMPVIPVVQPLPGLGGIDLSKIGDLLTNPLVKKALGGQPVTINDVLPQIPTLLALLQGHAPPPPPSGSAVIVDPISPPVAPTVGMSNTAFNWSTGIGGAIAALTGSGAGLWGSPIPGSESFSIPGLLTFAAPLLMGAFGVPAPAVAAVTSLWKKLTSK